MINIAFTQADIEMFLFILARVTSFMFLAPFFGQANTPIRLRLGFAIFVSFILFLLHPRATVLYTNIWGFSSIVVKEAICGLILGFFTNLCQHIIFFAGKIIDMETGLSMAQIYDPMTRTSVSITGNLYSYMILLLIIATNMHKYLLQAAVDSFTVIPIGEVVINVNSLLQITVEFLANMFLIGFEICLPVFAMGLVLNSIMGILAKVSPQMNMFAVGVQIKIIAGLVIMFLTSALIPVIANKIFDEIRLLITQAMQSMT